MEAKAKELLKRESDIESREIRVCDRENAVLMREAACSAREKELISREETFAEVRRQNQMSITEKADTTSAQGFKIFSDPQPSSIVVERQQDFLKNQHRLYLKLHDPNVPRTVCSEPSAAIIGTKRPPPPPPSLPGRAPMKLIIPPPSVVGDICNKENIMRQNSVPETNESKRHKINLMGGIDR